VEKLLYLVFASAGRIAGCEGFEGLQQLRWRAITMTRYTGWDTMTSSSFSAVS